MNATPELFRDSAIVSVLALGWMLLGTAAHAQDVDVCNAVLSHGIYDIDHKLQKEDKYNLAKAALCTESNKGGSANGTNPESGGMSGWGVSYSARDAMCSSSYNEAQSNSFVSRTVDTINARIIAAWGDCTSATGAYNAIVPGADARTFTYRIWYKSDGPPYQTSLTSWNATPGIECHGPQLRPGLPIDSGGVNLLCTRADPSAGVTITANVTTGNGTLKQLQFAAVRPAPISTCKAVPTQRIELPFEEDGVTTWEAGPYCSRVAITLTVRGVANRHTGGNGGSYALFYRGQDRANTICGGGPDLRPPVNRARLGITCPPEFLEAGQHETISLYAHDALAETTDRHWYIDVSAK